MGKDKQHNSRQVAMWVGTVASCSTYQWTGYVFVTPWLWCVVCACVCMCAHICVILSLVLVIKLGVLSTLGKCSSLSHSPGHRASLSTAASSATNTVSSSWLASFPCSHSKDCPDFIFFNVVVCIYCKSINKHIISRSWGWG